MNIKTKISAKVIACAMALTAVLPVQGVLAAVTPGSDDFNRAELKVNYGSTNKSIGGNLFKAGANVVEATEYDAETGKSTPVGYIEIKQGGIGKSGDDGYLHMHTGFYPKSESETTTKNSGKALNQVATGGTVGGIVEKQYFIYRLQMRADDLNADFGVAHKINKNWYGGAPEMKGGKLYIANAAINYEIGQWYDVVVQYEKGSTERKAWVNGISVSGLTAFGAAFENADSFQVNQYSADYGTTSDCYIDNMQIYESDTSYDPSAESEQNLREDLYNRSFARITKDTGTVNIDTWNKGYSGFGTTTSALPLIMPYCGSDSAFLENEYVEPASGKGKQEGDSFVKAHIEPGSGVMKFYGSGRPAANSKTPLITPMSSEKDTVFEFSFYNDASSPDFSFVLKLDNAWRDIGFAVKDNVLSSLKTYVAANVALEQNQWYRAAVIVKDTGAYDLYLDGKKVYGNIATNLTAKPTEISAAQISFNRDANNAKDAYFDNFRVYDTASYVPENAEIISSGKYVVNKNTVENILTGTSVEEFIGQLTLSDGAYGRIYASDGTERTAGSVQPGDSLSIYTEYAEKVYNLSVSGVTAVFYKNSVSDENIIYKLDPAAEKTIVKIASADIDLGKALIAAAAYSGNELKQVKIADGETVEFTDTAECTQIAVYAWDSETMKPLSNRISTEPYTVYLVSDSICKTYTESEAPLKGWGQYINLCFEESGIKVDNRAEGGRSTKSFRNDGRWAENDSCNGVPGVMATLTAGDYVLFSLGHNDRVTSDANRGTTIDEYKENLKNYVTDTRSKGATPVFVTPPTERWTESTNSLLERSDAMKAVAEEMGVTVLDLNLESWNHFEEVGFEASQNKYYCTKDQIEAVNAKYLESHPDGDLTHFNEEGAKYLAKTIAQLLNNSGETLGIWANPEAITLN